MKRRFGAGDWLRLIRSMTLRKAICMASCCRWPILCALDKCIAFSKEVASVQVTCGRGCRYCDRINSRKKVG